LIQVRNVPDVLHRRLKARAAMAGMALSDLLLMEIRKVAEKPTPEMMLERLRGRRPVEPAEQPVDELRGERATR
jgi:hypothetical protein